MIQLRDEHVAFLEAMLNKLLLHDEGATGAVALEAAVALEMLTSARAGYPDNKSLQEMLNNPR